MQAKGVSLYHRTTLEAAEAILARGFRDAEGNWGLSHGETGEPYTLRGVWLSDSPLDPVDVGGVGEEEELLRVRLAVDESDLAGLEVVEEGKGHREWIIPAELLNRAAVVEHLPRYEVDGGFGWQGMDPDEVAPEAREPARWVREAVEESPHTPMRARVRVGRSVVASCAHPDFRPLR